jgi:hypothetical protein
MKVGMFTVLTSGQGGVNGAFDLGVEKHGYVDGGCLLGC